MVLSRGFFLGVMIGIGLKLLDVKHGMKLLVVSLDRFIIRVHM